jgi:two-component system nitrate/nitrite response regulator NarP
VTSILIAADQPLMLAGIESCLRGSGFDVVGRVTSGQAVLDCVSILRPNILLLDVTLPGGAGLDVLRILRERGDDSNIVLLGVSPQDADLVEALQLGVNGYVLKDGATDLLLRCLEEVQNGRRWNERGLLERGLDLALQTGIGPRDTLFLLTPRERAIAKLVSTGMSNRSVAQDLKLTEGTVKVWLHRIYAKLDVHNRTELAVLCSQT